MKMKRYLKPYGFLGAILLAALVSSSWSAGHEAYDVIVKRLGQTTQIVINGNGPFDYKDFVLDNPPRIVIDCNGSEHNLPGPRTYVLERGGVVAIRSSFTEDTAPKTRIIIDLKEKMPYVVFKEGKNLIIALDALMAEPFAQWQASKFYEYVRPPKTEAFFYSKGRELVTEPLSTTPKVEIKTDKSTPASDAVAFSPKSGSAENQTLINVEYENGDLVKIIRQFANWTNQNIVISPDVKGSVSVSLRDVPVRTALDIILKINGYGVTEEPGEILRISSLDEIRNETVSGQSAVDSLEQVIPLQTQIIGVEYSTASEIQSALKPGDRGSLLIDKRSNSLILTDTPGNITRLTDLIKKLDKPTEQINIESVIVEVSSDLSRDLGIEWTPSVSTTAGGQFLVVDLSQKMTEEVGKFLNVAEGVRPTVSLRSILSALETDSRAHVISKPNITVVNHKQANINSGVQVPYSLRDASGNTTTSFVQTGVQLSVTPHVNPNQRITLEVVGEVSSLLAAAATGASVPFAINTKKATTSVMVDNGATAVIGGLISNDETSTELALPFLSKLPIIGKLFFTTSRSKRNDREILFFITPTIISESPQAMY